MASWRRTPSAPRLQGGLMYALEIRCRPADRERLIAELWERGTLGILEVGPGLIAYFASESEALTAAQGLAAGSFRVSPVPENDWAVRWREGWRPFELGAKFFLAPEWDREPAPSGRIRLSLRPGRACGTGLHPCTRLCLELLEEHVTPGLVVVDVGTGSGLLAAAAALLGAGRTIACDLADEAIAEARERFQREAPSVLLFQGSLRAVRPQTADLVLANISAAAVVQLAPEIKRVAKPGGVAVLSGFPARAQKTVLAALGTVGFRCRQARELEGWQALVCYTP
ncbi:MAG: 50S ribosomal protein L11 methyltransferase [Bryobacterales bacterium]|nr:50S ribosomal protein L11 methyltransferase [Bryobacterales bacterium]